VTVTSRLDVKLTAGRMTATTRCVARLGRDCPRLRVNFTSSL